MNRTQRCTSCGAMAVVGTTCPRRVECPTCGGRPGSPCMRPSGHRAPELHIDRVLIAEAKDREKGLGPEQLDPSWEDPDVPDVAPGQLSIEEVLAGGSAEAGP